MEPLIVNFTKDLLRDLLDQFKDYGPEPTPEPGPVPPPSANIEDQLIQAHNLFRSQSGLPPLERHPALMRAARRHSRYQAATDTLSHTGRGGSSVGQRASAEGYNWFAISENVGAGQISVDEVMGSWLRSTRHRLNILNNWKHIGVGVASSSDNTLYRTTVFGR